jgi:hypothetical protein
MVRIGGRSRPCLATYTEEGRLSCHQLIRLSETQARDPPITWIDGQELNVSTAAFLRMGYGLNPFTPLSKKAA